MSHKWLIRELTSPWVGNPPVVHLPWLHGVTILYSIPRVLSPRRRLMSSGSPYYRYYRSHTHDLFQYICRLDGYSTYCRYTDLLLRHSLISLSLFYVKSNYPYSSSYYHGNPKHQNKQWTTPTVSALHSVSKRINVVVVVVVWYCLSGARLLRSTSRGGNNWWNWCRINVPVHKSSAVDVDVVKWRAHLVFQNIITNTNTNI